MHLQYLAEYPGLYIGGDALDDEDGAVLTPLPPIEQAYFMSATRQCLGQIRSRPIGKELLRLISLRCQGVGSRAGGLTCTIYMSGGSMTGWKKSAKAYIKKAIGGTHAPETGQQGSLRETRRLAWGGRQISIAGVGRSATVGYNPFISYDVMLFARIGVSTPPFIALAHELVHCLHTLSGDAAPDSEDENAMDVEEARTVGAGRYRHTRISENAIRAEHGIALRRWYLRPGDCGR
jgi:hypothetical protein